MSRTISYGDVEVPLIERDWVRTAQRLPYRKTYLLKPGDGRTANTIWEHYVQLTDEAIPAGAVIAREMIGEGAEAAVWTECHGRGRVFMSPDLVCVEPTGVLARVLNELHEANGRRWAGLPDAVGVFPSGVIAMREAKVAGKDRMSETQHNFARIARPILGDRAQFAVVESGRTSALGEASKAS